MGGEERGKKKREEKKNKKKNRDPMDRSKSWSISHFTNKDIEAEIKKITW